MSTTGMLDLSRGTVGLCVLVVLAISTLSRFFLASCRPRNFPPGPQTVPFLGNITQVPKSKGFLKCVPSERICSIPRLTAKPQDSTTSGPPSAPSSASN